MNKINFNDWQEISIKKDIKNISNKISRKSSVVALIVELFFTVCSIVVSTTEIVPKEDQVWVTSLFLALLLVVPLLIVLLAPICKQVLYSYKVKNGKVSYKELIDTFDNETNQYIMMAYSFYECIDKDVKPELTIYYYIQANYYVNKCIVHLETMQNYIPHLFSLPLKEGDFDKIDGDKISYERIYNLLSLIQMMRNDLLKEKQEALLKMNQEEKNSIEIECEIYNKKIDNFVILFNDFLKTNNSSEIQWKKLSSS